MVPVRTIVGGCFASRLCSRAGESLCPGFAVTAGVVAVAFGLGLVAGWITDGVPALLRAEPSPSPSPSPIASIPRGGARLAASGTHHAGVDCGRSRRRSDDHRCRDEGRRARYGGAREREPDDGKGDVRWVSVAVEDGVSADAAAFGVRDRALNDNRAWGTGHSSNSWRPTASPTTGRAGQPLHREGLVPRSSRDEAGRVRRRGVADADSDADARHASARPSADAVLDSPWSCAQDGVIVISGYDWTAGYPAYADDYAGARELHAHSPLGPPAGPRGLRVQGQTADVMVVQEETLRKAAR